MQVSAESLAQLLDGLDGDDRHAREALVQDLVNSGHSLEDLLQAKAADQLALLPVTDVLRDEGRSTISEIAQRCGVDAEQLRRVRQAAGLAVSDEPVYGPALERYAVQLRASLDAGLSVEAVMAFNVVLGAAASSIAGAARDSMRGLLNLVDPDGSEHSRAIRAAELTMLMQPTFAEVVVNVLDDHVLQLARREVTGILTGGAVAPSTEVTVGFADVVGFTALGDSATTEELSAVAHQLETATRESLFGDTQLVKTLGDGVMICARSADDALSTVLGLVDRAARVGLPDLRIGLAHGPAISRAGDWFGAVVNRASRLTALAAPGGILIDDAVHHRLTDCTQRWRDEGKLDVRGISAPVPCWSSLAAGGHG